MKIVSYEMGRLIVLFPAEEIRPRGGIYIPTAAASLQQRYAFAKPPDFSRPLEELDREGYKFGHGRIEIEGREIVIGEFGYYGDGISITCFDTEYADIAWDDFFAWSQQALGLRPFTREPRRVYRSQLVVEFDRNLSGLLANFSGMANIIQEAMHGMAPHTEPVELTNIAFGMDPTKLTGPALAPFSIERKLGAAYETGRYFCQASLSTRAHIATLERIERELS